MPELKFDVTEPSSGVDVVTTWLPRVGVAAAFLMIGVSKFQSQSTWIRTFNDIGWGNWFRYFTGAIQILGAVLVLIPRTCLIGVGILATTMLGAMLIWILVLQKPGNAPIPALVLIALIVVGFQARRP